MPRTCSICGHVSRDEIEAALLEGRPFRELAERFATSSAALFRHKEGHIPDRLAKAQREAETLKADSLVEQMEELQKKVRQIIQKAEADDDFRTALAGLKE